MALKAVLEKLDGLSPEVSKEYKKVGDGPLKDKFVLDVEAVGDIALDDVGGLKRTVVATRTERDEATKKIKDFEGIDVAKAKDALEKVKNWDKMTPEDKVREQIETAKKAVEDKLKGEKADVEKKLAERDAEVDDLLITTDATRILTEKYKGASPTLLLPHIKARVKVIRGADGKPRTEVRQADGKTPELSKKLGSTGNMELPELLEVMSKDAVFAPAFPGTSASGTAGRGNNGRGTAAGGSGAGGRSGGNSDNGDGDGGGKPPSAVSRLSELRRAGGPMAGSKQG